MIRTSRSPIFNQSHDFSCFITDARGHARVAGRRHSDPHRRRRLRGARPAPRVRRPHRSRRRVPAQRSLRRRRQPSARLGDRAAGVRLRRAVALLPATARTSRTSAAAPPGPTTRRRPRSSTKASACRALKLVERGVVRDDLWQLLMINTPLPGPARRRPARHARLDAHRRRAGCRTRRASSASKSRSRYFDGILDHADRRLRAAARGAARRRLPCRGALRQRLLRARPTSRCGSR